QHAFSEAVDPLDGPSLNVAFQLFDLWLNSDRFALAGKLLKRVDLSSHEPGDSAAHGFHFRQFWQRIGLPSPVFTFDCSGAEPSAASAGWFLVRGRLGVHLTPPEVPRI